METRDCCHVVQERKATDEQEAEVGSRGTPERESEVLSNNVLVRVSLHLT